MVGVSRWTARLTVGLVGLACLAALGCGPGGISEPAGELCDNLQDDDDDGLYDCLDPDCASEPECSSTFGTEDCRNGRDDDGDGRADCDDFDCSREPSCRGGEVCDNGADDDGDGRTDCDDSECAGHRACSAAEVCDNGVDDDRDTNTDCDDPDCERFPACHGTEVCDNGTDDDGDGDVDCADKDCRGNRACVEDCGNGVDDDGDSRVDCDDPDCEGNRACETGPREDCENRRDDDGDGAVDCDDSDCRSAAACGGTPEDCTNRADDDGDGRTDCDDSDCAHHPACATTREDCDNRRDDDGDSRVDCDDSDCAADPACSTGGEDCTNRSDDDGDGHVDCDDTDCARHPSCAAAGEDCDNGLDDDGDRRIDCCDSDCTRAAACAREYTCNNREDDDCDGWPDCDDSDCEGDRACGGTGEICDNGRDDDGDGTIDCCDSDCATSARCREETVCTGGIDEDCDFWADCDDWDCLFDPACMATDPCAGHGSCADCTADWENMCGYCATTGTCAAGTSAGPSSGSCTDWDWYGTDCGGADACGTLASCTACTAAMDCGYCQSTSVCMAGASGGPTSGTCGDWRYLSSDCGTADPCAAHGSCAECTADYANMCGYCATTGTCAAGSSAGPASGTCATWAWLSSECPTGGTCSTSTECGACTLRAGCGWCESTSRCLEGSGSGPTSGSCSTWRYYSSECSGGGDACASHATCEACTADYANMCGYCESTGSCARGSSTGPSSGSCSDWAWYADDCGGSTDPCASHGGCSECTADYANNCGYCLATSSCAAGTVGGPSSGSCSDWAWYASECSTPTDPCGGHSTCTTCAADYSNSCGWCESTWTCLRGSSSGPSSGSCSDWAWSTGDCGPPPDPCGDHWDCGSCAADYANSCGYCADTGVCSHGSSSGPSSGSCTHWAWNGADCDALCTDTCEYSDDGSCDDGGPGSDYAVCTFGSDCTDCGPR